MKLFKIVMVAALALTVSACSSDKDAKSTKVTGYQVEEYKGKVALKKVEAGVKAGTYEDFTKRAGDRVFFGYDSYGLVAESTKVLKRQSLWLKLFPKTKITVEGHCDERGTTNYNFALGERRANAVKRYLVAQGISSSRVNVVSYGKSKPSEVGHNNTAWSKNRRGVSVFVK